MNKQEAIEEIKDLYSFAVEDGPFEVDFISRERVLDIISKIDKPQKPVVPKFVAEWYEKNNYNLNTAICNANIEAYIKVNGENDDSLDTFEAWLVYEYNSISILVQMKLFGYEIEQEKLYTVEIPDPHGIYKIRYLFRDSVGNIRIGGNDYRDVFLDVETHLTESEIKEDFEWAWDAGFAKEVEAENDAEV